MRPGLQRLLGLSDIALIVVGSVIGSGIFRTPSVVAQRLPIPGLMLAAWVIGGAIALCGAFVLGELAARRPGGCGPYAYLSEAFHPIVGFAYGWAALLASFTGGIAAAAVIFAGYFVSLTGFRFAPAPVAIIGIAAVAIVNALGVRQGNGLQFSLTVLKIVALAAVIAAAFFAHPIAGGNPIPPVSPLGWPAALGVALIPILFSYNGAMVANFMVAESKDVAKTLPRGLILGIACVVVLYVLVNASCVHVLGIARLAQTEVPVSAVLRAWVGTIGGSLASLAVVIVTLGFVSNRMLTVPRLYQAMAQDGLFFPQVARISPRTHAPIVAIMLQAAVAMLIASRVGYGEILNYVVATFYIFNGLLALALFVIRAKDSAADMRAKPFRAPGHPYTTAIYLVASWGVAIATCVVYPRDGLMGLAIVLSAVPAYLLWKWLARRSKPVVT